MSRGILPFFDHYIIFRSELFLERKTVFKYPLKSLFFEKLKLQQIFVRNNVTSFMDALLTKPSLYYFLNEVNIKRNFC